MVASHLLKAVHLWTDLGYGDYELFFIRDKEQREIDFLVTRDETPWLLVEVKSSHRERLSPHLSHFAKALGVPLALQVAMDMPFVQRTCFAPGPPLIVPARTFLAELA